MVHIFTSIPAIAAKCQFTAVVQWHSSNGVILFETPRWNVWWFFLPWAELDLRVHKGATKPHSILRDMNVTAPNADWMSAWCSGARDVYDAYITSCCSCRHKYYNISDFSFWTFSWQTWETYHHISHPHCHAAQSSPALPPLPTSCSLFWNECSMFFALCQYGYKYIYIYCKVSIYINIVYIYIVFRPKTKRISLHLPCLNLF